ncbi:protein YiiM [Roseibium sp. TrichSKD4]|uniref:MOSC domain-containing protein n=1 Tax=Roseibium sp. TrichSKD4 TaxID=744980 RepID=UPI0001E5682B|nr:MOSC domain-containing protein [Roseibium sp. TrichSKD4]EFO31756.1 protein YiiM [Roseibium sp. TrichSKD4]
MVDLSSSIAGLYSGQPEDRWPDRAPSAIRKSAVTGPISITTNGFASDQQADLSVHGGPDKALHFYCADHYQHWRDTYPDTDFDFAPGKFGENISAKALNEKNTHLGDIFRCGTALIQISHGRQPCWKLNLHTGIQTMAPSFQKTLKTGWYFRVLEEGVAETGDQLDLTDRPCPNWPLHEVIAARFNPRLDPEIAAQLAALPELAGVWRQAFEKKTNANFKEDTSRRLKG